MKDELGERIKFFILLPYPYNMEEKRDYYVLLAITTIPASLFAATVKVTGDFPLVILARLLAILGTTLSIIHIMKYYNFI